MNINSLTAIDKARTSDETPKATDQAAMGQDAFMKLLLTQLQNQDPTSPQADGEFLAQLAQFSQLEQLQAMNKKLDDIAKVFSLVGATTTTESSNKSTSTGNATTAPVTGSN